MSEQQESVEIILDKYRNAVGEVKMKYSRPLARISEIGQVTKGFTQQLDFFYRKKICGDLVVDLEGLKLQENAMMDTDDVNNMLDKAIQKVREKGG